jgi:hypothetical protein
MLCLLGDNAEKYGRAGQMAGEIITWHLRFVRGMMDRITETTDTLKMCDTYCLSTVKCLVECH